MGNRFQVLGFMLLSGGALMLDPLLGPSGELRAATSTTLDILSNDRDVSDTIDIGAVKPVARPNPAPAKALPVSGNPLWSVPFSVLSATQERPIFSASRRPPQRAVAAVPQEQAVAPPAQPAEPERPALALIGAVVGDTDAIAVFLDRTSQKIVRLRQGDSHGGWELSSVQGREVTLRKAERSEVLVLQRQATSAPAPAVAEGGAMPPLQPIAGAVDGSYAPFTPRSTPKNGESDGL
jgi:general secretion pathway protein N